MFSTTTGGKAPVTRTKIALTSALSLGALILPVTLAGPAQAATTQSTQLADTQFRGCTMKQPPKPVSIDHGRYMWYGVSVFCAGGKTIQVHQAFWEDDPTGNPSDFVGQRVHTPTSYTGTGWKTFATTAPTPNTEAGAEEVFQGVRFRVKLINGWSDWSPWEYGAYVSVPQP